MSGYRRPLLMLALLAAAVLAAGGIALAATVNGTEGNDTLQGTSGDDTMNGLGGADWLNAAAGADVAYGGTGNDTVGGGVGADKLYGQDNNDTMTDGTSTDPAIDELYGGNGDDKLTAYAGDDALRGEAGVDILKGGLGNDNLDGGLGADNLSGQDGDDTIVDGPAEDIDADVIDGGPGNDAITAGGGGDTASGQDGADRIEGGAGNDALYGANQAQSLPTGGGNDTVSGGSGDDKVYGADGADRLYGGDGSDSIWEGPDADDSADTVEAGPGDDFIYVASGQPTPDSVSCGDGQDTVQADPADAVAADCENVELVNNVAVQLEENTPVAEALATIDAVNAEPEQLVAAYPASANEHTVFHSPEVASPTSPQVNQSMIETLQAAKEQALAAPDPAVVAPEETAKADDPVPPLNVEQTVDEIDAVIGSIQSDGAAIDIVEVLTSTPVSEIEQDPEVMDAEALPASSADDETMTEEETNNWWYDQPWSPRHGWIHTGQYPNGERFVHQRFVWNDWRMAQLKGFPDDGNVTWEQEATYNYTDYRKYLGWKHNAYSNMPGAYFDHIRGNIGPVFDYTIGTVNAMNLRANHYYYTLIVTDKGTDNNGEWSGVNGQVGRRGHWGCTVYEAALCVGKVRTDIIINPLQGSNAYTSPGERSWFTQRGR